MNEAAAMLLLGGVGARLIGAGRRFPASSAWNVWNVWNVLSPASWIVRAIGVWLMVSAIGGWAPFWIPLALGLLAGALAFRIPGRLLSPALDGGVVLACGLLAVPPVGLGWMVGMLIAAPVIGLALDRAVDGMKLQWQPAVAALVLVVGVLGLVALSSRPAVGAASLGFNVLHMSVWPMPTGQRVEFEHGAVAWFEPRGRGHTQLPIALLFHGNDAAGSQQRAAHVLRLALRDAGFDVLSVDHPGYGQSALLSDEAEADADAEAEVEAWDPLPVAMAALTWARQHNGGGPVYLVGHSMGNTDVLRLLAATSEVQGAVVSGIGYIDREAREQWLHRRFHERRGMNSTLPLETWRQVHEQYYDVANRIAALPPDHPPIVHLAFEYEHDDLRMTRDQMHELIPGHKSRWLVPRSDHYFSAQEVAGLMFGNAGIARHVSGRLRTMTYE